MSLRRALFFSYLEKYGSYLIGLGSTMIISRILSPADIGAFSVGMALVGIVAVLREFGVSTYLVQEAELTEARIRAAFTLTTGTGLVLAMIVLALSGPAGAFYNDSRVTTIIVVLALGFAITPLGSVAQSLLARELAFGTLTWVRLAYSLAVAALGIGMAAKGMGPMSLAWAATIAALVNTVLSFCARPHSCLLNFHPADLKRVFRVGGPQAASAIVEDVANSLPELILGRTQTLAATGLFSRARGLSQLAHQVIARAAGPVIFSALAKESREGRPVAPLYIHSTLCVTATGWAALAVLAILADPVIHVLYGPQWRESASLLRWLCGGAMILLLTAGANHALLAAGGALDLLRARLTWFPLHVACLVIGGLVGAEGMAAGTVASSAIISLFLCLAVRRRTGVGLRDHLLIIRGSGPLVVMSVAGAAPALLISANSLAGSMAILAIAGLGAAIGFLAALRFGKHPLREEVTRFWAAWRAKRGNTAQ